MTTALRRQHLVQQLHRLGERAVDELLAEIGAAHGIEANIIERLERYAALDRRTLAALGVDRLAAQPLLIVGDAA